MIKISSNILFIAFTLSACHVNHSPEHYFQGTITYKGEFIRKNPKFDTIILKAIAGEKTTLFVKEGNYLSVTEKGITTRILYRNKENIAWREKFDSDSVFWSRGDMPGAPIIKLSKKKNALKVLGIACDEMKVEYGDKIVFY